MTEMLCDCLSLISLPDITKWNTDDVTDNFDMYYNCFSLLNK